MLAVVAASAAVQAATTPPTAPEKMTSPAERQKMKACEAQAAAQQVRMDQRAKFIMDCMTAK
jgi:hypothetical protein